MGLVNNNLCSLCSTETDFIEHLFFECSKIKTVWEHVVQVFKTQYGKTVSLNTKDVLLGIIKLDSLTKHQLKCLNHMILIAKMCISKFRYGTPIEIRIMFDTELTLRRISW